MSGERRTGDEIELIAKSKEAGALTGPTPEEIEYK